MKVRSEELGTPYLEKQKIIYEDVQLRKGKDNIKGIYREENI
jgi:hypothetical protein